MLELDELLDEELELELLDDEELDEELDVELLLDDELELLLDEDEDEPLLVVLLYEQ